jgi:2-polyprenyl-6-methoxyphenol hydroxylase-like FAD-dependent oxidoreductase
MPVGHSDEEAKPELDLLIAGLGPGGCAAALAAHAEGLSALAVEARGIEATRSRLILVRPGAQSALARIGLPELTQGRRTTTIEQVENGLRQALIATSEGARRVGTATAALDLCWHTAVTRFHIGPRQVQVTLTDAATGQSRLVRARHLIDATGGRLEALGRPARVQAGRSHWVATAQYDAPPWFEGIVGVRDRLRHEVYLLFPTWGRRGVIAYFDAPPERCDDSAAFAQRFEALAERLALGSPKQPMTAVDVYPRALQQPITDRVVAMGDSVGTVDVLWAAGLSNAIEDAIDVARELAQAQRESSPEAELARTRRLNARLFARHRASVRHCRMLIAARPLLEHAWPSATLPDITRDTLGPPPLLWPAIRFVFGRRPQTS